MPKKSKRQSHRPSFLKLHPHRHTGKFLHHRHTSYPALFLLLALVGAVLLTPVGLARADDYIVVTATVPTSLPSTPAVITSPSDGAVVYQPTITVSGTCPVVSPPIIVVLYDGSTIIGSQSCATDGSFAVPVSLSPGSHSIVPKIVNFTGQSGATGNPVLVTYVPGGGPTTPGGSSPTNPPGGSGSNSGTGTGNNTGANTPSAPTTYTPTTQTSDSEPEIITETPYILFGPNKGATWKIILRGGTPPYTVTINWGDGSIQKLHGVAAGALTLHHAYKQLRIYQVRIELRDAKGRNVGLSIVALSPATYNAANADPALIGSTNLPRNWILYMLYILTVIALTMLWHYERQRQAYLPVLVIPAKRRRPNSKTKRRP